MSCDFRVMRRDAWPHFVHRKLGVVPGWGRDTAPDSGCRACAGIVAVAFRERMGAETCHSLSLIDHIADTDWEREVDTFSSFMGYGNFEGAKATVYCCNIRGYEQVTNRLRFPPSGVHNDIKSVISCVCGTGVRMKGIVAFVAFLAVCRPTVPAPEYPTPVPESSEPELADTTTANPKRGRAVLPGSWSHRSGLTMHIPEGWDVGRTVWRYTIAEFVSSVGWRGIAPISYYQSSGWRTANQAARL